VRVTLCTFQRLPLRVKHVVFKTEWVCDSYCAVASASMMFDGHSWTSEVCPQRWSMHSNALELRHRTTDYSKEM
jgi:hypothetical protein